MDYSRGKGGNMVEVGVEYGRDKGGNVVGVKEGIW